jgi:energy-coupling factor transporter ATP-binding protein EcfA2
VAVDIAFGPFNLGRQHEEALKIVEEMLNILGLDGFSVGKFQ